MAVGSESRRKGFVLEEMGVQAAKGQGRFECQVRFVLVALRPSLCLLYEPRPSVRPLPEMRLVLEPVSLRVDL